MDALDVATTGPIAAATAATGVANGAVGVKQGEIDDVVATNVKLAKAATDHDAEVLLLTGLKATAV